MRSGGYHCGTWHVHTGYGIWFEGDGSVSKEKVKTIFFRTFQWSVLFIYLFFVLFIAHIVCAHNAFGDIILCYKENYLNVS